MALPVLDGNQSATTLSSVVTGGEHIVAHSVVSLGSTAISNITSAVSGVVVTIPPLAHLGNSVATDGVLDTTTNFIKIGGHQSGANQTAHIVHVSNGGAMSVDASGSSVTFSQASVTFGAITGSASILNFPSTQTIAGTVTANLAQDIIDNVGDVGYGGNRLVVGVYDPNGMQFGDNKPFPISGTVTANGFDFNNSSYDPIPLTPFDETAGGGKAVVAKIVDDSGVGLNFSAGVPISGTVTVGNSVTIGSLPAISGTVTANGGNFLNADNGLITKDSASNIVLVGGLNYSATPTQSAIDAIRTDGSGAVKVYSSQTNWTDTNSGDQPRSASQQTPFPVQILGGSVTIGSVPNGSLTTRFGTPTTANTAFATSAVTNANRKYLLIQNVTTGSNVITVGIGFTPTTTQGIQLTAGAGITFESSYIPTGAVYVLSSVTASNFTILEA